MNAVNIFRTKFQLKLI